jgi:hypothetical protein
MNDYYLKYYEKVSGKMFEGKRITSSDYVLRDPETGLKISVTYYRLCKDFFIDRNNKNDCCERIKKIRAKDKLRGKKTA